MLRGSLTILSVAVLAAACSRSREHTAPAAQADTGDPATVFDLLDDQIYVLPLDAPDELLTVPSWFRGHADTSLREGAVTSAWTTAPGPDGTPSAMVYRCTPDGTNAYHWAGSPEAWLAPLGVDPTAYPDLAPFTATATSAKAQGLFFGGPAPANLPAFSLDASVRIGTAQALPSSSQLVGVEEATVPGAMPADLPLARIRKTSGSRMGPFTDGTLDHADYVLRLHTSGGAGPGEGTACTPGDADVRDPFDAHFFFVRLTSDTSGAGGAGGSGGSADSGGGAGGAPGGMHFGPPTDWSTVVGPGSGVIGSGATGPQLHFP